MIRVGKGKRQPVRKHADGLVERYTVLLQVARGLLIIPFKLKHAAYLKGLTSKRRVRNAHADSYSRILHKPVPDWRLMERPYLDLN